MIINSGNTRHRGFEGEISYDLLAQFQHPPAPESQPETKDGKTVADGKVSLVPGTSRQDFRPLQLIVFSNVQLLDAEFTESTQIVPNSGGKTFVGNAPAYAPDVLWKGGISFQREKCFRLSLSAVIRGPVLARLQCSAYQRGRRHQFPNVIPSYKVFNLAANG